MCSKGCCKVGEILYDPQDDDNYTVDDIIDNNYNELKKYKAFDEMFEDNGHQNYLLPYYCVKIGHLDCLKYIAKLPEFMYHSDLADCAIEMDKLDFLKFIVEEIGDIRISKYSFKQLGHNCKEYVMDLTNGIYIPSKNKSIISDYEPSSDSESEAYTEKSETVNQTDSESDPE